MLKRDDAIARFFEYFTYISLLKKTNHLNEKG
jgi:hypothetical protein